MPKTRSSSSSAAAKGGARKRARGTAIAKQPIVAVDPVPSDSDVAPVAKKLPHFYTDCDDFNLCRRVLVSPKCTLSKLKSVVYAAFAKDYQLAWGGASDMVLYGMWSDQSAVELRTQRQLEKAIGYAIGPGLALYCSALRLICCVVLSSLKRGHETLVGSLGSTKHWMVVC